MITSCSARSVSVISIWLLLILLSTGAFVITESRRSIRSLEEYASIFLYEASADSKATRWAVLVAGSNGYENYRHQADICHAYQILKNGGLNDENIIVFMYDDIAYNEYNPTPGMVVNKPYGPDVYQGVPKYYTGNDTTAHNLYAVLLGKKQELTGGSGKVLESGPGDHVFFYYADHGSTGIIGMPVGEPVYAQDLIVVLEQMHEADMYKKMVIYVEACESGSMFNGLLSDELGIYTTTASDPYESSWATYCPDDYEESESTYYSYSINSYETTTAPSPTPTPDPGSPEYYGSCLGDMYSISWLEDCDVHDLKKETFKHQYKVVKKRTNTSHVMEYGNKALNRGILSTFMGSNPSIGHQQYHTRPRTATTAASSSWTWRSATQRDAKLIHLKHKIQTAPAGSPKRLEAEQRLRDEISGREEVDRREDHILKLLFGDTSSSQKALNRVRGEGQPVVDDWECFKTQVKTYEEHCGAMSEYGKKYTAVLAQLCNAGVPMDQFASASFQACSDSSK